MAATITDGSLAVFTVQQGPLAGQQFPVAKPVVTIGRTADNDIVINDPDVSRHHARLSHDGQQFIIEDLGSTNGTFVNNARITAPQPLPSGASLGLGALTLGFQSSLSASPFEPVTNVNVRIPQQPVTVPIPAYAPVPVRGKGGSSWPLILGGGAVVLLGLLALALAAFFFLKPAGSLPTAAITSPLNGSQVTVGEEMAIIATANDQQGVMRVELWVDGGLQDTVDNPNPQGQAAFPVQFEWTPGEQGSHTLEIRAYNRDGQQSESESVMVRAAPGASAAATDASALVQGTPTTGLGILVVPTPTGPGILVAPTATGPGILVAPTATGPGAVVQDTPTTGAVAGGCTSGSAFVADVTIPDYTQVQPGQRIDKIWRIRNSGTCPWGPGYQFAYAGGDQMNAPASQAVASTPPGGTADVQVSMYAPAAPGMYKGLWQMRDAAGQPFGSQFTVVVVVMGAVAPLPTSPDVISPADTPGLSGCSATIDFRADDAIIEAGDRTTIRWDVECVREIYFEGGGVTGHESREVRPAGTTAYTLRVVKNDGNSEERRVTVSVTSGDIGIVDDGPSEPDVSISFQSYDAGTGAVIFKIRNARNSPALESVDAQIINASSGESYSSSYSNLPFAPSTSPVPFESRLAPDQEAYLKHVLRRAAGGLPPAGVGCRARFTVYTGENRSGSAAGKTVDFTVGEDHFVEPNEPAINANISYHSYDQSSRWVTFRVVNTGGVTLESAWAQMTAPGGLGNLYGPATSNSPFRDNPASDALVNSVAPGATKYMRYKLKEAPPGTAVSAAIRLYSGEGSSGQSMERTVGFILP